MTFPDLKSIGFGPASHRDVLRLFAFLYCDFKLVVNAGYNLSRRQFIMVYLAVYLHALPYFLIVSSAVPYVIFGLLGIPTVRPLTSVDHLAYIVVSIVSILVMGLIYVLRVDLAMGLATVLASYLGVGIASVLAGYFAGYFEGSVIAALGFVLVYGSLMGSLIGCFALIIASNIAGGCDRLAGGITLGLGIGLAMVLTGGIIFNLGLGLDVGLSAMGSYFIIFLRPYYLPWHLLLLVSRNLRLFCRFHPVFWDHACPAPFPALHRLLIAYAEQEPEDGDTRIDRLITDYPSQRHEALRAKTVLIARRSAGVVKLTELSNILDKLPEGEKGYLAQTASLRSRAMAICRQQIYLDSTDRPFFREQAARQLRAEINAFSAQVAGFHEPLASEFRRAAEAWLRIADRQLAEAENQRGREETPQLFRAGDPVRLETEAFVERCEIVAALEHEIMVGTGCPGILLYGRRRMGKSTIIRNLDGFLPEMVKTVVVSMQNPAAFESESSFARHLEEEIRTVYTDAPRYDQPSGNLVGLYGFFMGLDETLARNGKRLLLCIDEFEEIDRRIGAGAFSRDLPATLRESVQNHRRITWLFAGSHHFTELRNVPWSSYLVSLRTIEVPPFTPQETNLLLTEPLKYSRSAHAREAGKFYGLRFWGDGGIDRIHRETGGWPHLVQLVASTVVDICNRKGLDQATPAMLEQAFAEAVVSGDTVLAELMLYKSEEYEAAWRYLAGFRKTDSQPPSEDEDVRLLLKRYLLIKETTEGIWTLRIPLMHRWLKERT